VASESENPIAKGQGFQRLGRRPPGEGQRGLSDNLNAYSCDQTLTMPLPRHHACSPLAALTREPVGRGRGYLSSVILINKWRTSLIAIWRRPSRGPGGPTRLSVKRSMSGYRKMSDYEG